MGVNDDRLSAGEQNELRALVTAGAGRMRAARRRRMQAITGGAAVVLVAAVVGAVALTALGSPDRVATPVETTTSAPTPSRTDSEADRSAVPAFGGECSNAVDDAWLAGALARPMEFMPPNWPDPASTLAGAISCTWGDPQTYPRDQVTVVAFPVAHEGRSDLEALPQTCAINDQTGPWCRAAAVTGGTWISVFASGDGVDDALMTELVERVTSAAQESAEPRAAARADGWWKTPTCAEIESWAKPVDIVDPEQMPYAEAGASNPAADFLDSSVLSATSPFRGLCVWVVNRPASDGGGWAIASAEVVPGGRGFFDTIAATAGARPFSATGAERAVLVPPSPVGESYANALVVAEGENLLIIRGDNGVPPESLAYLVEPYLTALNATLG